MGERRVSSGCKSTGSAASTTSETSATRIPEKQMLHNLIGINWRSECGVFVISDVVSWEGFAAESESVGIVLSTEWFFNRTPAWRIC